MLTVIKIQVLNSISFLAFVEYFKCISSTCGAMIFIFNLDNISLKKLFPTMNI